MDAQNFTTKIVIDQTPEEVFDAINNVRGWWSQEIDGDTDKLGAEFNYHYKDVHRCKFKITEFVHGKKVVWHVVDNYFNFTKEKSEWKNTDIVFEIARKGNKTELRFTHVGLVPEYECYNICTDSWSSYINSSLHGLITKGKGNPNPIEEAVNKAREMSDKNYFVSFVVNQSPEEVFAAVNNVRGWWSEDIEGSTDKAGGYFTVHFKDIHHSSHHITELIPGKKVVWHTTTSKLNFIKDKNEWNNTDIVFEITGKNGKTELRFTHVGLFPSLECYTDCSNVWGFYINDSLYNLITTGKGKPNPKEGSL